MVAIQFSYMTTYCQRVKIKVYFITPTNGNAKCFINVSLLDFHNTVRK